MIITYNNRKENLFHVRYPQLRRRFIIRFKDYFHVTPDDELSPEVAKNFLHNFLVNAGDAITWLIGDSFSSFSTIIPVFASTITSSPIIIGLIPAFRNAGWFLPQLFLAPRIENKTPILPTVIWLGISERLPYLFLTIYAFILPHLSQEVAVALFLGIVIWLSLASGFVALPWQELIARVIPTTFRGRFFGLSHLIGSGLAILSAFTASIILKKVTYPYNYGLSFLLATTFLIISFFFFIQTREPKKEYTPKPKEHKGAFLNRLRSTLKEDKNFRTFLISRAFSYTGSMAYGFIAVYGIQHFDLSDAYAGIFTVFLVIGSIIGYGFWGFISDRFGHKMVLTFAALCWATSLLLVILAPEVLWINLSLVLMSFANTGEVIGDINIVFEFGREEERPFFIGMARTLTGPFQLIAPIAAGVVIKFWNYQSMFILAAFFALTNMFILWFFLKDPRKQKILTA